MIELAQLRYAAAVARHGSFSAAARDCGVAQPTVSGAVAALEDALGARLFERTTRRVVQTPSGARLLPLLASVLAAMAELEREAAALKAPDRKRLRIGFSPLLTGRWLDLLFEPFGKQQSGVELIYKECMRTDMEARLDDGSLDVACGTYLSRAKNRGRRLLHREPLHWIAPGAAPQTGGTRVSLREVAASRLLLTVDACGLAPATRDLFRAARIAIDEYAGHAISYATLEEWAELGIGGAILPASRIHHGRGRPIVSDGKPIEITYEVVWRKDLLIADHAKQFVTYLSSVVPKLVGGLDQR